jgi:hypothetical protein
VRSSSDVARVSNRHPPAVRTIGMGIVHPFWPTSRYALSSPAATILCDLAYDSRNRVVSSAFACGRYFA